jgi:hypothetical protein
MAKTASFISGTDILPRISSERDGGLIGSSSTGSLFFPALRPELLQWILESLYEHKIPFVFANGAQMASFPQDLIDRFNALEGCCITKFAPQWEILEHAAVGFFIVRFRFPLLVCGRSISRQYYQTVVLICSSEPLR